MSPIVNALSKEGLNPGRLERTPDYSTRSVRKVNFFKNPGDLERLLDALRKAGLPEK